MARTLKQWGVPPDLIGRLVTTVNSSAYVLTAADFQSMGVVVLKATEVASPRQAPPVEIAPTLSEELSRMPGWRVLTMEEAKHVLSPEQLRNLKPNPYLENWYYQVKREKEKTGSVHQITPEELGLSRWP